MSIVLKTLTLCFLAFPPLAFALEFIENRVSGEIVATGIVEHDDAEKISNIITTEYKQRHRLVRGMVTVSLDSPGGSLLGGLNLGYALRRLGVHANVDKNQSCMSACALAFLGGQQRTVEGAFGVHAASFDSRVAPKEHHDSLDSVQKLGAITTAYAEEMTGRSDVALRALSTPASKIAILNDNELASMGVITVARRPSQFGRPGFRCPPQHDFTVLSAICVYLDISLLDQELNTLYSKIQNAGAPSSFPQEQERWRRYRNSCINDGQPNGYASVVYCVREAYEVRRDQLLSIWLAISASKSRPGADNWRPLQPIR